MNSCLLRRFWVRVLAGRYLFLKNYKCHRLAHAYAPTLLSIDVSTQYIVIAYCYILLHYCIVTSCCYSVELPSSDISFKWLHAIKQEMAHVQSFVDYFAVVFYITSSNTTTTPPWNLHHESPFKLGAELRRLGFNLKKNWRITNINSNYE